MTRKDLEALGISDDKTISSILDLHHEEMDPVRDRLTKAEDDLSAEKKISETTRKALEGLGEGEDVPGLKKKIKELEENIKTERSKHQKELDDRNFDDKLRAAIRMHNGLNEKAIIALVNDMDKLKVSNNLDNDIEAEMKRLTEAEDSKMLFAPVKEKPAGKENTVGTVSKPEAGNEKLTLHSAIAEHYSAE